MVLSATCYGGGRNFSKVFASLHCEGAAQKGGDYEHFETTADHRGPEEPLRGAACRVACAPGVRSSCAPRPPTSSFLRNRRRDQRLLRVQVAERRKSHAYRRLGARPCVTIRDHRVPCGLTGFRISLPGLPKSSEGCIQPMSYRLIPFRPAAGRRN